jgi:hypothetical protein
MGCTEVGIVWGTISLACASREKVPAGCVDAAKHQTRGKKKKKRVRDFPKDPGDARAWKGRGGKTTEK